MRDYQIHMKSSQLFLSVPLFQPLSQSQLDGIEGEMAMWQIAYGHDFAIKLLRQSNREICLGISTTDEEFSLAAIRELAHYVTVAISDECSEDLPIIGALLRLADRLTLDAFRAISISGEKMVDTICDLATLAYMAGYETSAKTIEKTIFSVFKNVCCRPPSKEEKAEIRSKIIEEKMTWEGNSFLPKRINAID
ncbi:MAG: hypothetical protein AB3N28_00980 [Kordiimonas sp.]